MTETSTLPGTVAYMTGEYPKVSHTFIQREIAALRAQGTKVITCTARRAPAKHVVGKAQLEEQARTFCLVETGKRAPFRLLGAHVSCLFRSPDRWFSALALAWRTRPPGARALLWQLFYFLEAGLLVAHLRRENVMHLHNHFADSSCTVTMLASTLSGIPFSFTLHGPAIFYKPMHWRIDEKIARARFVSCISHFCRSQAMYFSDQAHWPKLRIVHCGVSPAQYGTKPRDVYGKRIVFVGRLDAVKGVPLLLDAFDNIRAAHPEACLTIIGDGPDRSALEARASAMGSTVSFLGYQPQEEISAALEQADMLVLPSFAEGLPVVLMEAMASRVPVIASQVAGVPELVEEGISGFVVPPGDVETLTDRLNLLLSDPGLCQEMGESGRAVVEAEFDQNSEAIWLQKLFAGAAGASLRPATPERTGKSEIPQPIHQSAMKK